VYENKVLKKYICI